MILTFIVSLLSFSATTTHGAQGDNESLQPRPLIIFFGNEEATIPSPEWPQICRDFATHFEVGRGPFLYGFASQATCAQGDQENTPSSPDGWLLIIKQESERSWRVTLSSHDISKAILDTTVDAHGKPEALLANQEFAETLAILIMDNTPHAMFIPADAFKEKAMTARPSKAPIQPAPELDLFTLEPPQNSIYTPKICGSATAKTSSQPISYNITLISPPLANHGLWAHHPQGIGTQNAALRETLLKIQSDPRNLLEKAVADTFGNGLAGMRYGVSLINDKQLLENMRTYSLLAEVRGGPLNGLRAYWDLIPQTTATLQTAEESVRVSRLSAGWSFAFASPVIFDAIDLVGKLGATDVDARFAVPRTDGSYEVTPLRLKNAMNLGVELGLEKRLALALVRLWAASDLSGIVDIDKRGQIQSLRAGVDFYYKICKINDQYSFNLLVFGHGEKLAIRPPKASTINNESVFSGVRYNLAFAGAGITVSW